MSLVNLFSSIKKVAVLGFGKEGISSARFLTEKYNLYPDILDKNRDIRLDPELEKKLVSGGSKFNFGDSYLDHLSDYDLVIRSAGVSIESAEIRSAKEKGVKFVTNTGLFFRYLKDKQLNQKIIGVTGTKGKSTTTTLIHKVIKENLDENAVLAGNIGIAPTELIDQAINAKFIILEMSSYQLCDLDFSPHISVIQGIVPEHLDFHHTFQNYFNAKSRIVEFHDSESIVIFNADNENSTKLANRSPGLKIGFSVYNNDAEYVRSGDRLIENYQENSLFKLSNSPLLGEFNIYNIFPALIVGKILKILNFAVQESIISFRPLPHRLEPINGANNILYINDSLSTVPESAAQALEVFQNRDVILIAGGYDRGLEFDLLAEAIKKSKVKKLILFRPTGEKIITSLIGKTLDLPAHIFVESMEEAVRVAKESSSSGDVVLLSPGSPSFGLFKDYSDRGDQFKRLALS